MISVQQFFAENGIFIIIPVIAAIIKVIHDMLPTYVFLGGSFLCLGLYIFTKQMKLNQESETRAENVKNYEQEFEKIAKKEERKKAKREVIYINISIYQCSSIY